MQVHFFSRNPSTLFTYEFWISDDIGEPIKVCGDIFFLPGAKLFRLFCHFILSQSVFCFILLFIIMFRNAELRHKRLYGCRKKRLNIGTFF